MQKGRRVLICIIFLFCILYKICYTYNDLPTNLKNFLEKNGYLKRIIMAFFEIISQAFVL